MLSEYINAAMRRAHYELFEDGDPPYYYGEIDGLQGPMATGQTLEQCREELREVVDEWLAISLIFTHPVPEIDGQWIDVDLIARKVVIEDEDEPDEGFEQEENDYSANQANSAA